MKRILITGANSYIGMSFEKWCSRYLGKYVIDTIDMRGNSWSDASFSGYDTVFHVAGIAHVYEKAKMESFFYKVNCDLAVETARKAKRDLVKQFIFMSSMSVYGNNEEKIIDSNTIPKPISFYGKSKLKAEQEILCLQDETFNIAIIRPPMVYGKGCKGNYTKLRNLAQKIHVFPDIYNQRSMIYIENLCEFIRFLVENNSGGLFFPQNAEYVCTSDMVKKISNIHNKKIFMIKLINPLITLFKIGVINKVFGSLVYEKGMSEYIENYCIVGFEESLIKTEV